MSIITDIVVKKWKLMVKLKDLNMKAESDDSISQFFYLFLLNVNMIDLEYKIWSHQLLWLNLDVCGKIEE